MVEITQEGRVREQEELKAEERKTKVLYNKLNKIAGRFNCSVWVESMHGNEYSVLGTKRFGLAFLGTNLSYVGYDGETVHLGLWKRSANPENEKLIRSIAEAFEKETGLKVSLTV